MLPPDLSLPVLVGTAAASITVVATVAYLRKSTRKQAAVGEKSKTPDDVDHLIADVRAAEAALEQAATTSRLMGDSTAFFSRLENYDKDHIDQAVIARLAHYVDDPDFRPEKVRSAANAAGGLCAWVHAIVSYHHLNNELKVKRAAVARLRHGDGTEHGGKDSMCSRWTSLWRRSMPNKKIMPKEAIPLLAKQPSKKGDRKQAAKEMAAMKKQAPPMGNASPFPTVAAPTEMRAHIPDGGFNTCVPGVDGVAHAAPQRA